MLSNINSSIIKLCILILSWYFISSLANIISKHLLTIFPHPLSVTLSQLFHGWIYSIPLLHLMNISPSTHLHSTRIYYITIIVPLAIGKLLTQLTSQISLRLVTVSYTHTVKALMPLFTVILSRIVLGEKQSIKIYLSLIPIVMGVIIASIGEIELDTIGLISAVLSTCLLALQNIYSKRTLKYIDIHHLTLFSIMSKLSWCLLVPFWFLLDGSHIDYKREVTLNVMYFLLLDGLCNFIYNVLAFTMISYLSPLSYAIAGSTKRLVVIMISIVIFQNSINSINLFGIGLAIIGVIVYNRIKHDEKKQQLFSVNTLTIQQMSISSLP